MWMPKFVRRDIIDNWARLGAEPVRWRHALALGAFVAFTVSLGRLGWWGAAFWFCAIVFFAVYLRNRHEALEYYKKRGIDPYDRKAVKEDEERLRREFDLDQDTARRQFEEDLTESAKRSAEAAVRPTNPARSLIRNPLHTQERGGPSRGRPFRLCPPCRQGRPGRDRRAGAWLSLPLPAALASGLPWPAGAAFPLDPGPAACSATPWWSTPGGDDGLKAAEILAFWASRWSPAPPTSFY